MRNPERSSAHEERLDKRLQSIERELELLDSEPATPYNRLRFIQLRLRALVVLNSWFVKDPNETLEGIRILQSERTKKQIMEQRLRKLNAILNNWGEYEGLDLDTRTLDDWLEEPTID